MIVIIIMRTLKFCEHNFMILKVHESVIEDNFNAFVP